VKADRAERLHAVRDRRHDDPGTLGGQQERAGGRLERVLELAGLDDDPCTPAEALQFHDALVNGYWHARRPEFFARGDVRALEWLRLPGDIVFIAGGIVPLVYLAVRMVANRNRPGAIPAHAAVDELTGQP